MRRAIIGLVGLAAAGFVAFASSGATAAPDCAGGQIQPRVLYRTGDVLEYGIFDPRGRFFYSDQSSGELMRIDHLGASPKALAAVAGPGAIVFSRDGSIIIGTGDGLQQGAQGDSDPTSGLLLVNPDTGAEKTFATGLGMANGVAIAPDGTIYATNDAGNDIDRVKDGKVTHPWARVYSTNGVVVSPDNRYLYVSQTFAPAAIQRISIANPSQVTPFAVAGPGDISAGLDDMTMDGQGNLYVAANGAGQVWKVSRSGSICVIASGFHFDSAVNFGVGANARNLYVVAFDGTISELPNVLPAQAVTTPPPSVSHRAKPQRHKNRHGRHKNRHGRHKNRHGRHKNRHGRHKNRQRRHKNRRSRRA
jgi:sugar lactone lactonase YvrE